ncbi:MAG: hypothetical protein M0Q90_05250 [Bacteroidales bacterium]|nr:hypothetical protein [Bacteroidales bacterium]
MNKHKKYLTALIFGFSGITASGQITIQPKKAEKIVLETEKQTTIRIKKAPEPYKPDSIFVKGRNFEVFDSTLVPSHKALGGNIFLGHGIYNGNISTYFSNTYFVGINIEFYRKNFIIQIDDYIGFGKTKRTLKYPDQKEWRENKAALSFMFGSNFSYSVLDTKHITLVPLVGINVSLLSASIFKTSESEKVENGPFLPYYKIGFYIDFKTIVLLQNHLRLNKTDLYYNSLRLSFGLNSPIGNPKHAEFYEGSMFYVTIGMGGLTRNFSRK